MGRATACTTELSYHGPPGRTGRQRPKCRTRSIRSARAVWLRSSTRTGRQASSTFFCEGLTSVCPRASCTTAGPSAAHRFISGPDRQRGAARPEAVLTVGRPRGGARAASACAAPVPSLLAGQGVGPQRLPRGPLPAAHELFQPPARRMAVARHQWSAQAPRRRHPDRDTEAGLVSRAMETSDLGLG